MNIKTISDLLSYVETEEKAQRLINYINTLENYTKMKEIDIREFTKENYFNKLEIERLNNIIDELLKFIKDMFVDEAISNSFDMTKEEFINYIKSKLMESDKE